MAGRTVLGLVACAAAASEPAADGDGGRPHRDLSRRDAAWSIRPGHRDDSKDVAYQRRMTYQALPLSALLVGVAARASLRFAAGDGFVGHAATGGAARLGRPFAAGLLPSNRRCAVAAVAGGRPGERRAVLSRRGNRRTRDDRPRGMALSCRAHRGDAAAGAVAFRRSSRRRASPPTPRSSTASSVDREELPRVPHAESRRRCAASVPTSTFRSIRPNTCALDALRRLIARSAVAARGGPREMPGVRCSRPERPRPATTCSPICAHGESEGDGTAQIWHAAHGGAGSQIERDRARTTPSESLVVAQIAPLARPAACPERTLPVRTRFNPVTLSPTSSHMRRIWRFLP